MGRIKALKKILSLSLTMGLNLKPGLKLLIQAGK